MKVNNNLIFIIAILATSALAHECNHPAHLAVAMAEIDAAQGMSVITDHHLLQREQSASNGTYRPLKIFFDLSNLKAGLNKAGLSNRIAFYEKVFEATGKWWESVLSVNDDRSQVYPKLKQMVDSYCAKEKYLEYFDFTFDGKQSQYDMFIKINLGTDSGNVLAYAGPFARHPETQRPISGAAFITKFGDKMTQQNSKPFMYSTDTMIHEFGHIFGFIAWDQYQKQHLGTANGKIIWKGPKTLALAREYRNCATLEGVPLQSKNGRVGGHFNEDDLGDELMTPFAANNGGRASGVTISLLEDTKWYKGDYTRAEHFTFGKGAGCGGIADKTCTSPAICNINATGIITSDFKGQGYCRADKNGCASETKYSNRDCSNGKEWSSSYKTYGFGPTYGGNCAVVKAKLKFKYNGRGPYSMDPIMPVEAECSNDMESYPLTFKKFGYDAQGNKTEKDALVTCTKAGSQTFNGEGGSYTSTVECADPKTFCTKRFGADNAKSGPLCHKSCAANGRCQKAGMASGGGDNGGGDNGGDNGGGDNNGGDDNGGGDNGNGEISEKVRKVLKKLENEGYSCKMAPREVKRQLANYAHFNMKKLAMNNEWACWCYSDYTRSREGCPNPV